MPMIIQATKRLIAALILNFMTSSKMTAIERINNANNPTFPICISSMILVLWRRGMREDRIVLIDSSFLLGSRHTR